MDRAEAIWYLSPIAESATLPRYKEALEMAIAALREQEQSKWISVKERLPEDLDKVLVLFEDGGMMDATYDECIDDESRFGTYRGYYDPDTLGFVDDEWIAYENVTHWMPLPEPPKEGADHA